MDAETFTLPEKPPRLVRVMVELSDGPATEDGLADMPKSGTALTDGSGIQPRLISWLPEFGSRTSTWKFSTGCHALSFASLRGACITRRKDERLFPRKICLEIWATTFPFFARTSLKFVR